MLPIPWLMPSVPTLRALHPHLLIVIIRLIYLASHYQTYLFGHLFGQTYLFGHDFYTSSFSVFSAVGSQGQGRVSLPLCSLSRILPLSSLLIHQTPTDSLQCVKYHAVLSSPPI